MRFIILFLLLFYGANCWAQEIQFETDLPAINKPVIGWTEHCTVSAAKLRLTAQLSPAADESSIQASKIEEFRKNEARWVKFQVRDESSTKHTLELPVARKVKIKLAGGDIEERYLVNLKVCLGNLNRMVQVNLRNIHKKDYQIFLGRRFLAGKFLLDPDRSFTVEPTCKP